MINAFTTTDTRKYDDVDKHEAQKCMFSSLWVIQHWTYYQLKAFENYVWLRWILKKRTIKKLFTHVESHANAVSLLESGEQRQLKAINKQTDKQTNKQTNVIKQLLKDSLRTKFI